jgi:CheY-like chemotaxis protein
MILIVDGDQVSAPSLARLLRYNGHSAEVVPSPIEALALLPTRKPLAIVAELVLQYLPGVEFIRAIRADAGFGDVPIIVYTGEFSQEAAQEALSAGAVEVIVKGTVGTQSLLARIERHLPKGP